MDTKLNTSAALVAVTFLANLAGAEIVTVEFSGAVITHAGASAHFAHVVDGERVVGTVSYDTSTPGVAIDSNVAAYVQSTPEAVAVAIGPHRFRSEGMSVAAVMTEFVGVSWSSGANEYHRSVSVSDGLLPDKERNYYNETSISGSHVTADGVLLNGGLLVSFVDDPSIGQPPALILPRAIDPAVFRFGQGAIQIVVPEVVDLGGVSVTFPRPAHVLFAIYYIRTIPEPTGTILAGCAGLCLGARKRRLDAVRRTERRQYTAL
ncbi:MAG: hypothetical protein ACRCT8_16945 [Lacipirellulaceae bacterium]